MSAGEYLNEAHRHDWKRRGAKNRVLEARGRATPSLRQLQERLRLQEEVSEIIEGLNDILLPATEFVKQELSNRSQLPDDSPEVTFLNGLLGVIQQNQFDKADDIDQGMLREKIGIMADKLETMVGEGDHGDLGDYTTKLVSGLRRFQNRIDPQDDPADMGGEEEMPPEGGEEGGEDEFGDLDGGEESETPPEGGEEGSPGGEEEPEEDEADKLARELGVS